MRVVDPIASTAPRRAWLLGSLVLAMSACSTLPGPGASMPEPAQRWSGRFALQLTAMARPPDGERSSGRFALSRHQDVSELSLISPLGTTLAQARIDDARASLRTADGREFEADDAEALTEQVFGWRIPVRRLPDWIEGRIARVTERHTGDDGVERALAGDEAGWSIRFDPWTDTPPRRVVISFPGHVVLTLVIDDR